MTAILRAGTAALVFGAFLALAAPQPAGAASDPIYTGTFSDLALSGYDPVAYFTEGEPVEGSDDYEYEWMDATWRFATSENLAAFQAEPEKYAPQYGGYCAYAVSQGYTASSDPHAWKIVDDKLYLNYSKDVQKTWEQHIPGYIMKAEGNWPAVLDKKFLSVAGASVRRRAPAQPGPACCEPPHAIRPRPAPSPLLLRPIFSRLPQSGRRYGHRHQQGCAETTYRTIGLRGCCSSRQPSG